MHKILSIRIITASVILLMSACSSTPEKRVNEPAGPLSARARNHIVSEDPAALVRVGFGFEQSGQLANALKMYRQALAADPNLFSADMAIARVEFTRGQIQQASKSAQALIAKYPKASGGRRLLSRILIEQQRYDDAFQTLKPLLNDSPEANDLILAGKLLHVEGDILSGRAMFEQAMLLGESQGQASVAMAMSFAIEGAYETAVGLLQSGLSKASSARNAQRALAIIYALSGQPEAAESLAVGVMDDMEASEMRTFFQILPKLHHDETTLAVMFEKISTAALQRIYDRSTD